MRSRWPQIVLLLAVASSIGASAALAVTITPLLGTVPNARLGTSVAIAGDLNGDGFDDLIAGAPFDNEGRAYILFGGPAPDNTIDLTLTGEASGDFFGAAVAPAGDVNGDGFADVIVGAPRNGAGGGFAGRAYVYFGGPGLDNAADWVLTSIGGDQFGWSVASAGDVNGDNKSDVVVGAYVNTSGAGAGRAYVYYGGAAPDVVADLTLSGQAANDNFGFSVASAGDLNADGFSDVIVGAINNDNGGTNAGRAHVFYGGPGADAVHDIRFTGLAPDDRFGYSVAPAGDVNGDTYADVIVGAFQNDAGGGNAGAAYVYYGGPVLDQTPDLTLIGAVAGGKFGGAVARAGDVNGDGWGDVVVGAFLSGGDIGRVYVYHGGPAADATVDRVYDGHSAERFGVSVAGDGDLNGDGRDDLAIGADTEATHGVDAGAAYMVVSTSPLPAGTPVALALIGLLAASLGALALRRGLA